MSETVSGVIEAERPEREFKSDFFTDFVAGVDGEAGIGFAFPGGVDEDMRDPDWPTAAAYERLESGVVVADSPNQMAAISSYGFSVYRAYLREKPIDKVLLDTRVFMNDVNVIDVLAEAAHFAIDDNQPQHTLPFMKGMIEISDYTNFPYKTMKKYLGLALRSAHPDTLREYVDFMNANTVKTAESSKLFLKEMAHGIAALETEDRYVRTGKLSQLDKQLLLESIGHAWIRKAMPVAEIDWLP